MPNGDSDHCGSCRHNRVNIGRSSTVEERLFQPSLCMVRNISISAITATFCANHYVGDKTPIGPLFSVDWNHERIPFHSTSRPLPCTTAKCRLCGAPSKEKEGVEVADEQLGTLQFCCSRHYVKWWKGVHPGELLRWDCDAGPGGRWGDPVFGRTQATLDLAASYLAMGDKEGARAILEQVLRYGNNTLRAQASRMLERC